MIPLGLAFLRYKSARARECRSKRPRGRIERPFVLFHTPPVIDATLRNGSGQECMEAIDFRRVAGDPDGAKCAKALENTRVESKRRVAQIAFRGEA